MKKILIILLILAMPAYALDYAYINDTLMIGNRGHSFDIVAAFLNCEGTWIDTLVLTNTASIDTYLTGSNFDTCAYRLWNILLVENNGTSLDTFYYNIPITSVANFVEIGTPSAAQTCRCYAYAYHAGSPVRGAYLSASLNGRNVRDTCNSTTYAKYTAIGPVSDSTGLCYIDLPYSACLSSQNTYHIKLNYNHNVDFQIKKYTVPSQDSVLIEP